MPSDPRPDVQQYFIHKDTQAAIRDIIYVEWPEQKFCDAVLIVERLAQDLHRYQRPIGDGEQLLQWLQREATVWTRRMRFLSELREKYDELMIAAIIRGLHMAPEDYAVEPKDGISDLILHLLEKPKKIDGLLSPKRAKQTSVLFSLTKSRTRGYRTKLTRRHKKVDKQISDGRGFDCECVDTPEEIASVSHSAAMRQVESESSAVV